ncbi:GNAT family N-acetyltransferase [Microbacterium terricola]|uniref:UPF0256 protein n=1 Tax=Microbacterium terricola TaxID=344163 RepID=A0ABM8DZM8_9MICO|nr:GNAT family N-acetyltransferase [Microbacterium terricola]UYK41115.1 GNAT family N-acetyltransferase [Microbacterium terricola]BDV31123.1 UPF0256 protein [Microbacterium terricola]
MDDLVRTHHDGPVDGAAAAALADRGLRLTRVPNDDRPGFGSWLDAVARGFLDGERSDLHRAAAFERLGQRRLIGVFDDSAPEPTVPVGTFASWVSELTVPGGTSIPSCAISSVTVAPTHHRRGIARAMMEGELRAADALGVPVAVLTVSESTLYGRYGFASAAAAVSLRIETRRAGWTGPAAPGRVDFISRERWRELAPQVHERGRTRRAGEIEMPGGHWDRLARTRPDAEDPGKVRAVQYAGLDGDVTGVAVYSVEENHDDFTKSIAHVHLLLAGDDDAYAGLWRFFLQLDLIGEVRASELSLDEPLLWMIADQRAAVITVRDHQYVRVLDVPAALTARRYGAAGVFALDVADPLGIGGGRWVLRVDADGAGAVSPWEGDAPEGAVRVQLGTAELSALYLGGVSAAALATAGRLRASDVVALARTFAWHESPRLSFWY